MDISILVDGSASISFDQYGVLVNFIHDMIDDLTIGPSDTKIQLVTFSTSVSQRLKFKDGVSKATVTNALDNMIKEVRTIILTNLWFDVKGERKERGSERKGGKMYLPLCISFLILVFIGLSHTFFSNNLNACSYADRGGAPTLLVRLPPSIRGGSRRSTGLEASRIPLTLTSGNGVRQVLS